MVKYKRKTKPIADIYEHKFYSYERSKKSARIRAKKYHGIKGRIISIKFPYKKGGRRTLAVVRTFVKR